MKLELNESDLNAPLAEVANGDPDSLPISKAYQDHKFVIQCGAWIRDAVKQSQACYKKGELYRSIVYTKCAIDGLKRYEHLVKTMIKENLEIRDQADKEFSQHFEQLIELSKQGKI